MQDNEVRTFSPENRRHWRAWLQQHHIGEKSVWLVFYKNQSGISTITWSEAVDEALCFGWIDSVLRPLDENRFMRFFSPRKKASAWSKINKEKVLKLVEDGLMTKAGFESIEAAKQNGSWTLLDQVEALLIPQDLASALNEQPGAERYIEALSKSDKKAILQWVALAKRPETRSSRICEIVRCAAQNQKPKAIQWTKKAD